MDKYSKKLIELLKDHIDPMVKADRNLPSYSLYEEMLKEIAKNS